MSQQTAKRDQLIKCLEDRLKRQFYSERRLSETLAGQTQQSNYLVIDGGNAAGRVSSGSNYQT
ncbi:MAG TPA: hypothetical protein P5526_30620 [Anaerolineae bacterium]|nr:hypothetical protein [Anaerolineales bacterium]HRV96549.1 hypothetical protein [Anaerolineae bacterium]